MRRLRLARAGIADIDAISVEDQPILSAAPEIISYVIEHGTPTISGFLAEPVKTADGRAFDWYSTIPGTATPLTSLQGGDRIAAEERLHIRLQQLRVLAETASDRQMKAYLSGASTYPGLECVFVVGQEPVLTQWGSRSTASKVANSLSPPVLASVPARVPWPWLAGALLLVLGWTYADRLKQWWEMANQMAGVTVAPAGAIEPTLIAELRAERTHTDALRREVEALRKQFEDKKKNCSAETAVAPLQSTPQPEIPATENQVAVGQAPVQEAPKVKKKNTPSVPKIVTTVPPAPVVPTQKEACAQALQQRKPWQAPELIFVIDASGSMGESVGSETRLDAAKESVATIADNLPADVDTALVKFTSCNSIDNDYFLSRSDLKQKVNALAPVGGTPLARSIERAANILSRDKDTVMVVVTDGEDNCQQKDPCQIAAAAKASHPKLTINVVDVSGSGLGSCIAQAGGGKVLPARTSAEIKLAVQQASYVNTMPDACHGEQ